MKIHLLLLTCGLSCLTFTSSWLQADLIVSESFDYASGTLKGNNGGSGNWTNPWSSDDELVVAGPGLTYVDSLGNALDVAGLATQGSTGDAKKGERDISEISSGDLWLSVLITGAAGDQQVGLVLDQKFFVGQGRGGNNNGNTWAMYDQDGLVFDSGITAGGDTSFFVAKIEDINGSARAWLWRNPDLNVAPDKANALNSLTGSAVKEFTLQKIEVWNSTNGIGIVDELRLGTDFASVSPFTAVPEPSSFLMLGGLLATATLRRQRRSWV